MTRPKIPIYPRPVSPIIAESVQSSLDEIYYDDSSDAYSDAEQHALKRRRIEKLGEQYLRGDGLFIMTAGLKGPMREWANPWLKKREQKRAKQARAFWLDTREEVPETTMDVPGLSKSLLPVKSRARDDGKKRLNMAANSNRCSGFAIDHSPTPVRRNNKLQNPDHLVSTKRFLRSTKTHQALSSQPGLLAAVSKQPMQGKTPGLTPTLSSHTKGKPKADINPLIKSHVSLSDQPGALPITKISKVSPDRLLLEHYHAPTTKPARGSKITYYDRKSITRSVHRLSHSTRLPELECRPVADPLENLETLQKKQHNPDVGIDETDNARHLKSTFSTEPSIAPYQATSEGKANFRAEERSGSASKVAECASMPLKERLPPVTFTQSSMTTITSAMPSAQVVPTAYPPLAESGPSISTNMIEPEVSSTDNKASSHHSPSTSSALRGAKKLEEDRAAVLANGNESLQHLRSREGIIPFSAFKSSITQSAMNKLDTQEVLATITPLGYSTMKTIPQTPINKSTPATATRVKSRMQKKRASFAAPPTAKEMFPGSSQGSIKGSLKVSKGVSMQMKKGEGEERLSYLSFPRKSGLDMETSDKNASPREKGSFPGLSSCLCSPPNLQVTPASSEPLPTANTMASTSSAYQQDAQQELIKRLADRHNGSECQPDFNLTSAMDDLGSFLGTWDADTGAKEFSSGASSSLVKSTLKSKSSTAGIRQ